jgi:hypothetical protein
MAKKSKKISQLSGLGEKPNPEDIIPLTHVEDKTGSQEGTTRKVTVENLMKSAPVQSINGQTGDVTIESLQGATGAQGPKGPQGDPGPAGPAGLNWMGLWSSSISYSLDDAVGFSGASYFCIQNVSAGQGNPSVNSTNWALLASQGAKGADGAQGLAGPKGDKGDKGDPGNSGDEGPIGPTGDTGPKGDPGDPGAEGPAGPVGPAGPAGSVGSTGAEGPQGPKGDKGDDAGTGSLGDNPYVKSASLFDGKLPDQILMIDNEFTITRIQFYTLSSVSSTEIIYSLASNAHLGSGRNHIKFDNNINGDYKSIDNAGGLFPVSGTGVSLKTLIGYDGAVVYLDEKSGMGINSNSIIKGLINFNGDLPDSVIINDHTTYDRPRSAPLIEITNTLIHYRWYGATGVSFDNDAPGTFNSSNSSLTATQEFYEGSISSLQDVIDGGSVVFCNNNSGGNLSTNQSIKNKVIFKARIPDLVVGRNGSSGEVNIFRFSHWYTYGSEDRFAYSNINGNHAITFNNDEYVTNNGLATNTTLQFGEKQNSDLRNIIINNAAVYLNESIVVGDGSNSTSTGYATKVGYNPADESDTTSIVLDPGDSTNPATYKGDVVNDSGSVAFDASTGEVWANTNGTHNGDVNSSDGANTILDVDNEPLALLNGQVSDISNHSIGGLSDVETSSANHVPSDGDVLVWNESHNHWMPGQGSTALPDGGAGSNSLIRSRSDFEGVLPDSIMVNYSSYSMQLYLRLVYRDSSGGGIEYMGPYNEYVSFYNNPTGNGLRHKDSNISLEDDATSLQQVIDSGNAIYNGQRSGTSGVGGLTVIKGMSEFAGNLPDAIVVSSGSSKSVCRLYNISASHIWYCDVSKYIGFLNSSAGTYGTTNSSVFVQEYNSIQEYIDAGRALYYGAPEFSIKAWGTFDGTGANGTKTFTGGNVASIEKQSLSGVILYKVTFTNPMPHANYSVSGSVNPNNYSGAYFGVREDGHPVTSADFHIELRTAANSYTSSSRISFQVVC